MSQENAVAVQHSKKIIQDYVRDVKELEIAKYTLLQVNQKLKDNLNEIKSDADFWKAQISESKEGYETAQTQRQTKEKEQQRNLFSDIFTVLITSAFIFVVSTLILEIFFTKAWLIALPLGVIGGILCFLGMKDEKKQEIDSLIQNEEKCKEYWETSKCDGNDAMNFCLAKEALLNRQIFVNQNDIATINESLQKLYNIGIIPPSYREIDCVLGIDDIFYNDLADTMREAILLYEDRVFKKQVIRGMNNILSVMGNMAASMGYMAQTLKKIEYSVSDICHGVNEMIELQAKSNKKQEKLLEEMRSTSYATSRIQESQEKCEWYIEQRRLGRI